jgi:CRP-like cAMP-binding protein
MNNPAAEDEARANVFEAFGPRVYTLPAGEVLMRAGEATGKMYLVERGELEILLEGDDKQQFRINRIEAGRTIGEIAMLEGGVHTATVRAVVDSQLLEIDRATFEQLERTSSTMFERLLLSMSRNLIGHLRGSNDAAVESLARELAGTRLRSAMGTFLLYMLLGFAAYAIAMKALATSALSLSTATVITGPLMLGMAVFAIAFARQSGLPRESFGLNMGQGCKSVGEAILWTLPVLPLLVLGKWLLIREHDDAVLFSGLEQGLQLRLVLGHAIYTCLVPLQEFLARGVIQGPLFEFFEGTPRRRWFWAIIVSNTLFAVTHLHLTLTYCAAAFIGGIVWGLLYARQRSLLGPIVSHVIIGIFALWLLDFATLLKSSGG